MARRATHKVVISSRSPAQARSDARAYAAAEQRRNARKTAVARKAIGIIDQMAEGGVVRPPRRLAAGGVAGVPDINFEVLDDYLRGVFEAVLENMAALLPWPVRKLVEELLDVGRSPTADEFQRVISAVERIVG